MANGKGPGGSLVLKLRDVEEGWLAGQRPEPKLVADDVGVRHGWRDPAGYGARRRESGDTNGKNRPGAAGSRRETGGLNHKGHEGTQRQRTEEPQMAQMTADDFSACAAADGSDDDGGFTVPARPGDADGCAC